MSTHLEKHFIAGIHVTNRVERANEVQQVLTEYGKFIKTRLGLHELELPDNFSSPNGLILIEFVDDEAKFQEFAGKLNEIAGVEAKTMVFDHP